MKPIFKLVTILIIIGIVAGTVFVAYNDYSYKETENDTDNQIDNNSNNNETPSLDDDDDIFTDDDINTNEEIKHIVFVEEATTTWCSNCPDVANTLHKLYKSENPDFYYVSMVHDVSKATFDRLNSEYNLLGYPTVYIDGGYQVIMGSNSFESVFKEKLKKAQTRQKQDLVLNITSTYNETLNQVENKVTIGNRDNEKYTGYLKVYVTEIVSRWAGWDGKPFYYSLIDFAMDKEIELEQGEEKIYTENWEIPSGVYKENLFIIAVLFESETHKAYSNPSENKNEFSANYAITAEGTRVTEGKLPPSIGISTPKEFSHYILGKEAKNKLLRPIYIIGKINLNVNVEAESGVEKVEYIIKGPLKTTTETVTSIPYSYTWKKPAFGKYTITAKIYDKDGRTSSDSTEVYAFRIGSLF